MSTIWAWRFPLWGDASFWGSRPVRETGHEKHDGKEWDGGGLEAISLADISR